MAERWHEVSRLYHAARARSPEDRAAFLADACIGDNALQREVESLLAQEPLSHSFLGNPMIAAPGEIPSGTLAGQRLGSYIIQGLLGKGGMGEVYEATDTALGRRVAIKIVPRMWHGDPDRRARFDREARVLASLNHPNIGGIYGVEALDNSPDAGRAIVMELIDGETLAERLSRGALPVDECLAISRQIADALDAAHEQGIVHRDLKPANIKIRPDGVVKVLDFGLAKLIRTDVTGPDVPHSPTLSVGGTRDGVLLGTAAYMSPEQVRGKPVDRRTDIWAFGCVLYEMLSATRAFAGDTLTDVLAAVVSSEPDLSRVPPHVRALLTRCLEKDARRRLRDIGDAMFLLDASAHVSEPSMSAAASRRLSPLLWAGLAIATASAISLAFVRFREPVLASLPTRVQMAMPEGTVANAFRVSPDGGSLLLSLRTGAATRLALRSVRTGELRELPGTAGAGPGFWLRDGRAIAFPIQGAIKTISAAGGAPETLLDRGVGAGGGPFGCWANGEIVFQNDRGGFSRVAETGGEPTVLTVVAPARGELHHESPSCLPDGRFLYFRHLQEEGASGIYAGATNLPPEKQSLTPVLVADDGPLFVPGRDETRHQLLFVRGGTLFAQDFSPDRLELTGEPRHLADNVLRDSGTVRFTATDGGVLVFQNAVALTRQLTWFDREGRVLGTLEDLISSVQGLKIAPDGTRAAVARFPPDIWIAPFAGGSMARLTSLTTDERSPVWSPDSTRVAFVLRNPGSREATVYQQAVNSPSTTSEPLSSTIPDVGGFVLTDWSKNGFILMTRSAAQTRDDIWILPVVPGGTTPRDPIPLVQTTFSETTASFSPDGQWIAYISDGSGRSEVYVRRFLVLPDGTPSAPESSKRIISNGARGGVRWRKDGRELLYLGADGRMMAVDVDSGGDLRVGPPRALFPVPPEYLRDQPGLGLMDMLPDASRFLLALPPRQAPRTDLEVILNWR